MGRLAVVTALLFAAASARAGEWSDRYAALLSGLEATDPRSFCVARAELRERLPQADAADAAAMFRAFRAYYREGARTTYRRFDAAVKPFQKDVLEWATIAGPMGVEEYLDRRPPLRQAVGAWVECGFRITEGEGMLYPSGDAAVFMEFARYLPSELADYVAFRNREDAQLWLGDAYLLTTWGELRRRLARWESFARRYPGLEERASEVEPEIRRLAGFLFFGVGNSPVYDRPSRRILREVTETWQGLAESGGESRYRDLAAALVTRVRAGGGRITAAERALFEKAGLGIEFDRWWSRYAPKAAGRAAKK